ncbi:invasin domain 3-containing protein (plasmid) [Morganella morganii]|uniref:Ig-like domain-containing protein n=1 Tax=Morganella morganii TaxID=582 RepID=UPI0028D503E9|nr:invasin domain 3-containing protein [Morganella morganii]WNP32605.1 invasin domain 3-containing protein [Morganella morganii]
MINTMDGIKALLGEDNISPQTDTQSGSPLPGSILPGFSVTEPGAGKPSSVVHDNTVRQDDILSALPTLGLPDSPAENNDQPATRVAAGVSQAGQLLSADDVTDASLGYVRGIGESLLNQQVNDWLNQVGHARIQFGSNKTGDADVLVPLIDNPNSLLFSQVGLRANEERTTTNLGLGYRQYEDGWMWGVNSFYDYDITGSNSRVGVGGELWADYLKFAANGYFRVTDWHQSTLHEMRDYDERPANGFDIRAEGYLPDYPQLGAFAKYEQYFGDGVSLAGTTSSGELKSNPSVSTIGLSYTPFPLITFKGQTSRGDSNDSQVGMELSYRFGVSLSQQLDTDNVDLMRNLAGNRYDFVDRNYNIVMQYRKQELLRIALPPALSGEAAQTLPVTASVLKAKYGLKSLRWSAPELEANGGEIKPTGLITADITLPEYIFKNRNGEPQGYRVTAVGEDNEGNLSNTAEMWVNVVKSTEGIILTVTPLNQSLLANNTDPFTAVAQLKNDKGEVLPNKEVSFSVSGLKNPEGVTIYDADGNNGQTLTVISGPDGTATVNIISKSAGKGLLKAKMRNGNSDTKSIAYIADVSTAKIKTLELIQNNALADGRAKNIAVATVTDQFDNLVENFLLTAGADNGATVIDPSQQTDNNGQVDIRFSSRTAGNSKLMVQGTGTSANVTAKFIPWNVSGDHSTLTAAPAQIVADGTAVSTLTFTAKDASDNPVTGATVAFTVSGVTDTTVSAVTESNGVYTATLSGTKVGDATITVTANGTAVSGLSAPVKLIAGEIAGEGHSTLTAAPAQIVADGTAVSTLTFTAKDASDNPVTGATVAFTVSGVTDTTVSAVTESNGVYTATLSGTKVGDATITVTANGTAVSGLSAPVKLIAGEIAGEGHSTLTAAPAQIVADGTAVSTLTFTAKDASDNPVTGATVAFTVSGVTDTTVSAVTESNGVYTATLSGTKVGDATITVTANGTAVSGLSAPVKLIAGEIAGEGHSTLTAAPAQIVADGTAVSTLTFTAKDASDNPVTGATVAFTVSGVTDTTVSAVTESNGVYTATLSGTKVGDATITVTANGTAVSGLSAPVKLIAGEIAGEGHSTLTAAPAQIVADGTAVSTLTFTAKDASDNPVTGATVAFTVSGVTDTTVSAVTESNGVYTATLSGTKVGDATITVTANGTAVSGLSAPVKLIAGEIAGEGHSTLTAAPAQIVADGTAVSTLTFTAKDASDNPVTGATVAFTVSGVTDTTVSAVTESNGVYTATLSGTKVGDATITVTANGTAVSGLSAPVKLIAGEIAGEGHSTLTAAPAQIVADGTAVSTLTFTAKDASDNPVTGATVAFTVSGVTDTTVSAVTESNGVYTATLSGTKVGDATITVTANGTAVSGLSAPVKLIAGEIAGEGHSTLTAAPAQIVADGTAVSTLTFTAKDASDNPVTGATVAFTVSGVTDTTVSAVTESNGVYTATLSGTKVGDATITVTANGTAVSGLSAPVKLIAGEIAGEGHSTLTAAPAQIVADGTAVSTLTFTAKDASDNPVTGATVAFTVSGVTDTTVSAVTESNGVYTATLSGTKVGDATITVTANGTAVSGLSAPVKLIAGEIAGEGHSTLTAAPAQIVADGTAVSTLTFTAKDASDNPVTGATVAFTVSGVTDTTVSAVTESNGVYTATLSGTKVGDATITVTANGTAVSGLSAPVKLIAGQGILISFTADKEISRADGVSKITLTSVVEDAFGNPVEGAVIRFNKTLSVNLSAESATTDAAGHAVITATNKVVESVSITADLNGEAKTLNLSFEAYFADAGSAHLSTNQNLDNLHVGSDTLRVKVTVYVDDNGVKVPAPNAKFYFDRFGAVDRQNQSITEMPSLVDSTGVPLPDRKVWVTDTNGEVIIGVTDPRGLGVKSRLGAFKIEGGSNVLISSFIEPIFKVITSPDSSKAQYYGYMPEFFNGVKRPLLASEASNNSGGILSSRESWATYTDSQMLEVCGGRANIASVEALKSISGFATGVWPTVRPYRSSKGDAQQQSAVNLIDGTETTILSGSQYLGSCLK